MTTLRLILGDQLSDTLPTLSNIGTVNDIILLCEVAEEATYVKHHKKKIAFIFSAMRQFAQRLRKNKHNVRYIKLDDPHNTQSFTTEISRAIQDTAATRLVVTEPGEYRILKMIHTWHEQFGIPVEILTDTRFLSSHEQFSSWAKNKEQLRMEFFYRNMRQRYNILIEEDGSPTGGHWNYDKENRKPPRPNLTAPERITH